MKLLLDFMCEFKVYLVNILFYLNLGRSVIILCSVYNLVELMSLLLNNYCWFELILNSDLGTIVV